MGVEENEILLLYPSCRQKVTFRAVNSLKFNGSCSNFEHLFSIISHNLLKRLQKGLKK